MSAADFGILDFLLDKEMDGCKAFKNTSFSHMEDTNIIKEEILTSEWDADELLNSMLNPGEVVMNASNAINSSGGGSGNDVMDPCDVISTDVMDPCDVINTDVMDPNDMISCGSLNAPLGGSVASKADDLDSLDGLVGLPFDAVLDSGASDSGFSNSDLSFDQQLSPQSVWSTGSGVGGMGTASPHTALSPDHPGSICSTTSSGSGVLPSEPVGVADLVNLPGFGPMLGSTTTEGGCGDDLRSPMLSGVGGGTGSNSGRTCAAMDIDEFPQPDSGISSPIPQQTSSPQHYSASLNAFTSASATRSSMSTTPSPKSSSTTTTTPLLKTVTLAAPTFNTNNTVITNCLSSPSHSSNTATLTFSSSPSPDSSPLSSSPAPAASSPSPSTTTTTLNGMSGQTIVVTQGGGGSGGSGGTVGGTRNTVGSLVRNGTTTLLKTGTNSRSILLPVTVKDLNQVRTIKIISAGSSASGVAGRGVRTVVSTVRTPSSGALSSTVVNRRGTTLATSAAPLLQRNSSPTSTSAAPATIGTVRVLDTKGTTVLKASSVPSSNASTTITSPMCNSPFAGASTVTMIKEEHSDDDDDDSVQGHPYQQVVLNDEERRLLKKEGIMLPTHYPLTKQEERELKRIRRKIRNKISAQDSRKRKKEYIDGLEDRVKACTEENQELQKRIRHLEEQNQTLVTQLRRFQNLVTGGGNLLRNVHSGHTPHTSTALMMLILSAALFIVPSLKPQDANGLDSELSLPTGKMPTTGRSRSLLEAGSGNPGLLQALESVEGLEEEELQDSDVVMSVPSALSDHDYEPPSKRYRMSSKMHDYIVPPLDDIGPKHVTLDKGGTVDRGGTLEYSHSLPHTVDFAGNKHNNFSDPGGDGSKNDDAVKKKNEENLMWSPSMENQNSSTGSAQSVVVKLGKTLIDEFELE